MGSPTRATIWRTKCLRATACWCSRWEQIPMWIGAVNPKIARPIWWNRGPKPDFEGAHPRPLRGPPPAPPEGGESILAGNDGRFSFQYWLSRFSISILAVFNIDYLDFQYQSSWSSILIISVFNIGPRGFQYQPYCTLISAILPCNLNHIARWNGWDWKTTYKSLIINRADTRECLNACRNLDFELWTLNFDL